MSNHTLHKVIDEYFSSWIHQNRDQFLSLLDKDIAVKECTGDVYEGIEAAQTWFETWNGNGNKVLSWEISDRYFDVRNEVATVIWIFECNFEGENFIFEGASVVKFRNNKILKLDEYQMNVEKNKPYN